MQVPLASACHAKGVSPAQAVMQKESGGNCLGLGVTSGVFSWPSNKEPKPGANPCTEEWHYLCEYQLSCIHCHICKAGCVNLPTSALIYLEKSSSCSRSWTMKGTPKQAVLSLLCCFPSTKATEVAAVSISRESCIPERCEQQQQLRCSSELQLLGLIQSSSSISHSQVINKNLKH